MQYFSHSHRASGYLEWPVTQTAITEKPPAEIICFVKQDAQMNIANRNQAHIYIKRKRWIDTVCMQSLDRWGFKQFVEASVDEGFLRDLVIMQGMSGPRIIRDGRLYVNFSGINYLG